MTQRFVNISVQGTTPLLCGNVNYSDPIGEHQKCKKFFTDKKGNAKTDGVHRAIRILIGFTLAIGKRKVKLQLMKVKTLYLLKGLVTLTCQQLTYKKCLKEAAKKWKLGKDVSRAIFVDTNPEIDFGAKKPEEKDALNLINSREPKYQLAAFTRKVYG